jgi:methionyl-tRNA formyltransferase
MRLVFCGNPEFAVPTLDALIASAHEVTAVVTSPDKPRGRGRKLTALPVKERALAAGLPVLQPGSLKDPEFLAQITKFQPDAIVVIAFRILPRELFGLPRLGSFNVHPSLLPRGRGPAPIRWTLLRGEEFTGVSIIHLTETIDGGGILKQETTPVGPAENYGTLHDRLARMGARMLVEVIDAFERGTPPAIITQDETQVTHAPKLHAEDLQLDWLLPAKELQCRIRALSPEPGAQLIFPQGRLKVLEADIVTVDPGVEAGVLLRAERDSLLLGTGTGALRLKIVQPEGKRAMTVAEWLRGRPVLPDKLSR